MTESQQIVVLSDIHLSVRPRPAIEQAVCDLLAAYPDAEIVTAGDLFEFSAVTDGDPASMWRRLCEVNGAAIEAFRRHVARGGRLTLIAGNHDAPLAAIAEEVVESLGGAARVEVSPWFVRRGGVHIEHGHLWDRDNAPLHPLGDWSHATEPLGIALMRRFVARCGALEFAHAHDTTPVAGLARAFALYRFRAPLVIAGYFSTAAALCFEAGKRRKLQALQAEACGSARVMQLASSVGVEPTALYGLLAGAPVPTHSSFSGTFMRLYFDRILAGVAATVSATAAAATGAAPLVLGVLGVSSLYLANSLRIGKRYDGPVQSLRDAADLVADALGASCVVFGHTHVEEQTPRYVNLGSFAYCSSEGRPYALISPDGTVTVQRWAPAAGPAEVFGDANTP